MTDFTQQCPPAPNDVGLNPSFTPPLREWAMARLTCHPWKDVLLSAVGLSLPRVAIYQVVCEHLESIDRIVDGAHCFLQMTTELGDKVNQQPEDREWALSFKVRVSRKTEQVADTAMHAQQFDDAISHYSTALSLDPPSPNKILLKRSKAFVVTGSWKPALDDANQVIMLDPMSPLGYEMKHAALHKGGDYENAVRAMEEMFSEAEESPDQDIQLLLNKHIHPSTTRAKIRKIVQRTVRRLPRELINTANGRLYNRVQLASAFESSPIFNELVSSMTTRIHRPRIKDEVQKFFRYVMLSHKWEDNEPLYQDVKHISVYDLDPSQTHDKLQTFCKIVRDAGFDWAWSDTCCIDKSDHFLLQEALVAMFRWYEGSALVIVFLRGVRSSSQLGALVNSIWNTRAWTLQEYVAAKVVHFYTEDWTPYLDLKLPNHKSSPEIVSEMEQATGVPGRRLMALRPGLMNVREKLRLASTRQTTFVEDAAYSLLGIFSTAGIPAIYGEGDAALGRLLANVLARSGDLSILAWTGESGSFNSCLPSHVSVFNGPATSHLPHILDNATKNTTTPFHSSSDLNTALRLYDRLNELPPPRFSESRMTLPCIAFQLPSLSSSRAGPSFVYRTNTTAFGAVEIRTRRDLSKMKSLYLVHPWLRTLLEHEDVQSGELDEDEDVQGYEFDEDDVVQGDELHENEDVQSDEFDEDKSVQSDGLEEKAQPDNLKEDKVVKQNKTSTLRKVVNILFGIAIVVFVVWVALKSPEDSESPAEPNSQPGSESKPAQKPKPAEKPKPTHKPKPTQKPEPVQKPKDREIYACRLVARLRQPFGALLLRKVVTDQRVVVYKRVATDSVINVQFQEDLSLVNILNSVRTVDTL